jgi:hypothetical protein
MSIQVVCPNGHVLKVADKWAGRKGLCPVCKASVRVPKPSEEQLSEDAIMTILGKYDPGKSWKKLTEAPDLATAETPKAPRSSTEGDAQAAGSGPSPSKKTCPHCHQEIVAGIHICPHCQTYVAGPDDL